MDILNDNNLLDLKISDESKSNLSSIAQWANIYAIIGFAGIAINIIATVRAAGKVSEYASGVYVRQGSSSYVSLIVGIVISLLLNITLFAAAKNIKAGLASADQGAFNLGIKKMADYFLITGIILLVVLVIVALALLVILVAGASRF